MATWSNATVTAKGYALQAKLLSTAALVITRVVAGSGRVPAGQLVNQTAVSEEKQTLTVEALSYDDNGNAIIKTSLNNKALTSGYICNQIGIYASDPDEGEILYAITQEATAGEDIPSITEQPNGYFCSWVFSLTFSNSENISVTIDPANALTKGAADAIYANKTHSHIFAGEKVEGRTFLVDDETVTAGKGAEIFNAYSVNKAIGDYSHAEGYNTKAIDFSAHTEGNTTKAKGNGAHAEGYYTEAIGKATHAEGNGPKASGDGAHAEGQDTKASGDGAHAEGYYTEAIGDYSHAEGYNTKASGTGAHAEGHYTEAIGAGAHASGYDTQAGKFQFVCGKHNAIVSSPVSAEEQETYSSIFMIGYGTADTPANAFRITSAGKCYGAASFIGSGADFPEFEEWADGNPDNEDRRGRFVALDGDKIVIASSEKDHIIGVVSAMGAFIANGASENWHNMYLKDVFGENLTQQVEVPEETIKKKVLKPDADGKMVETTITEVIPAHTVTQFVVNPDYNPDEEYIGREFRKEWAPVGKLGQVIVVDDGTCTVGGYCKPSANGIGTAGEYGYYVRKRIDSTHIKVEISPGAFNK